MTKPSAKLMTIASLLAVSGAAQAHPGHDHAHWFSDVNHLLFYGTIAAVIGAGALVVRSRRKAAARKGESEE
ncbi:hypothetical protein [Pontibacterium sp.]|uniref:hypothetical protein n=1 Tax=Pontibacterium sp. TaxID=2036026 RepID=UPI003518655C